MPPEVVGVLRVLVGPAGAEDIATLAEASRIEWVRDHAARVGEVAR